MYWPWPASISMRLTQAPTFPASLKPFDDPLVLQKLRAQLPATDDALTLQLHMVTSEELILIGRTTENTAHLNKGFSDAKNQWEQNLTQALSAPLQKKLQNLRTEQARLVEEKQILSTQQAVLEAQPLSRQQAQQMNILRENSTNLNKKISTINQNINVAETALSSVPDSFFQVQTTATTASNQKPTIFQSVLYGIYVGGGLVALLLLGRLIHPHRLTDPAHVTALTGLPVLGPPWHITENTATKPQTPAYFIRTSKGTPTLCFTPGVRQKIQHKLQEQLGLTDNPAPEAAPVILVAHLSKTKRNALVSAVEMVKQSERDILGIILIAAK